MQQLICTTLALLCLAAPCTAGQPSLEKPLKPAIKLTLEDVNRPGTMVDVSTLYGKDNKPLASCTTSRSHEFTRASRSLPSNSPVQRFQISAVT